jgi:hypothetical protein
VRAILLTVVIDFVILFTFREYVGRFFHNNIDGLAGVLPATEARRCKGWRGR